MEAVRPGHDFLIRGGAGTGKTIVLLHALERIEREREAELELKPGARMLFLTYTNTLVKYDRYVAEILREPDADSLILTADSFFQSPAEAPGPGQRVDYSILGRLAEKLNTTGFFSAQELAVEVEDFIFGNLVTRREYVEEMIPRRGMRQPLSAVPAGGGLGASGTGMVGRWSTTASSARTTPALVLIEHLLAHPDDPGPAGPRLRARGRVPGPERRGPQGA